MKKAKSKPSEPEKEKTEEEKKPAPFGRWMKGVYELTFIITILIFGTLAGTFLALLLPLGFPLLILYKRYIAKEMVEES